jgi:hypothetical protein
VSTRWLGKGVEPEAPGVADALPTASGPVQAEVRRHIPRIDRK